jgi:hypothetical protein
MGIYLYEYCRVVRPCFIKQAVELERKRVRTVRQWHCREPGSCSIAYQSVVLCLDIVRAEKGYSVNCAISDSYYGVCRKPESR